MCFSFDWHFKKLARSNRLGARWVLIKLPYPGKTGQFLLGWFRTQVPWRFRKGPLNFKFARSPPPVGLFPPLHRNKDSPAFSLSKGVSQLKQAVSDITPVKNQPVKFFGLIFLIQSSNDFTESYAKNRECEEKWDLHNGAKQLQIRLRVLKLSRFS